MAVRILYAHNKDGTLIHYSSIAINSELVTQPLTCGGCTC